MACFWEQPGRLAQLELLVTQGLSARAIALRMKTTRNAVISAVHRKLPHCRFGGSPVRRVAREKQPAAAQQSVAGISLPPIPGARS